MLTVTNCEQAEPIRSRVKCAQRYPALEQKHLHAAQLLGGLEGDSV